MSFLLDDDLHGVVSIVYYVLYYVLGKATWIRTTDLCMYHRSMHVRFECWSIAPMVVHCLMVRGGHHPSPISVSLVSLVIIIPTPSQSHWFKWWSIALSALCSVQVVTAATTATLALALLALHCRLPISHHLSLSCLTG